jgi:ABC-type sugar transport system ATPase subunit
MVYVTHDQAEALALGDRIVALHGGRLQQVGTPDALYRQPSNRFVASLFGSHGINFLEGNIEIGPSGRVAAVGPWRLPLPSLAGATDNGKSSDRVVIGIRPEDARATDEPRTGAFPAEVEQTEYQGNDTFAEVRMKSPPAAQPAATLTVRCGDHAPPRGATVYISLCEDNLCWFDPATGENWARRGEPAK